MGRGLSEQQKAILLLAYDKRRERLAKIAAARPTSHEYAVLTRGVGSVDLYEAEILHEHFGFPVRSIWWSPEGGERPSYGNSFSMRKIGEGRYRSARASLSRAITRLEQRGLVVRAYGYIRGLHLTDEGVKVAGRLSVI